MPKKKAPAKKAPSKKRNTKAAVAMPMNEHKSVNIKKANNGFVISSYTDKGEKTLIAKTKKEANAHANKLLGL